jgi:glycerophosphoryl diester phosphodiesterase
MIYKALICLSLLLLISCSESSIKDIDNLNDGVIHIIGHGGNGFQSFDNSIPSNTWKGINKAVSAYNADGVEVDVQMTSDDQLVLYHNNKLQETTNCIGCVYDLLRSETRSCRYRSNRYFNRYVKSKVIKASEVLGNFKNRKRPPYVYLDVKVTRPCGSSVSDASYLATYAQALVDLIQADSAESFAIVTTKSATLLDNIAGIDSNILLYYENESADTSLNTAVSNSYDGITIDSAVSSKSISASAHNNGIRVVLFGIKSRATSLIAVDTNVDAVMTDNILLMQRIMMGD